MPHFRIEYSANLDARADIQRLCEVVREAALATGVFEIGAVRVRAFRAEAYAVADLQPENSFIDCVLRMGEGRSENDRKRAGEAIFAAMAAELEPLYATPHFALTFSIEEIDGRFSWKKNGMHARLRAKA